VKYLKEKDYVYEMDGAIWFKSTAFEDEKDRVLIRANGVPTYFASDIAYHKDKFDRGFDRVIDVWGADHHGYIPRVRSAISALGKDPDAFNVFLIQFVNLLRGGQQVAMSTRAGEFITLKDVIEEVGVDATRYFFVMRRSDSHLDFDLDLAKKQSTENPVYYIQYAHARICSVLKEVENRGIQWNPEDGFNEEVLSSSEEKKLAATLSSFADVAEKAAVEMAPHVIASYALDLAGDFHSFYNSGRIIGESEDVMKARLFLAKATGSVLATILGILGISAPERM
jgi:arginyl-tRNA synthetase